jgi:hypothetical protein
MATSYYGIQPVTDPAARFRQMQESAGGESTADYALRMQQQGDEMERQRRAWEAAAARKRELMAQGMPEAEAHRVASQQYQQSTDGGSASDKRGTARGESPGDYRQPSSPPSSPASPYRYDAGGPQTYYPDLTTEDPRKMVTQDRTSWYDRGNRIDSDLQGETVYRRGLEEGYRGDMDTAAQELRQTPGYTAEEQAGIMREGETQDLLSAPYHENYLSPEEQSRISGNPYYSQDFYDPGALNESNEAWAGHISDAINQQERGLNENLGQTREGMRAAITPDLALSGEYRTNQDAVLNTTAENTYGAIDPERLRMDAEYARQAGMTDAEVDEAAQMGARNVGSRYRAAIGDLERRAAESGNATPLAVSAARARLEKQSAVDAADAAVNARLAAREQQRNAATGVEGTRLGAEQTYSGLRSGAARDLGDLASRSVSEREQLRQGAARDISDRQMDTALATGQMGQQAAQYAGTSRIGAEQDIANRAQQTGQYAQTTGINMAQQNEAEQANRAGFIATNRQGVSQGNQTNQFDRGFAVNEALSGRTGRVGDTRIGGRDTYLGWASGQTGQQADLASTARGQRVSNFGTQSGAANSATGTGAEYDIRRRGQSFGTALRTGLGSALGTTVGTRLGNFGKGKNDDEN